MTFTYEVSDSDYQCILNQIGQDLKPEDWLKGQLDSLVNQCVEIQGRKKLAELGSLTDAEIELIKQARGE